MEAPEARRCRLNVDRLKQLERWVADHTGLSKPVIAPASADASFRRYFRLTFDDGSPSLIVMDAPPDKEDCGPFVAVAALLAQSGVNVPRVVAADLKQGFLLLTDLGTRTYLAELRESPASAPRLYSDAAAALIAMQSRARADALPAYDRELLMRELQLLPVWYFDRHRGSALSDAQRAGLETCFERLLANNLAQPRSLVHRDYHSRNLMVCSAELGTGSNPGILDFQDAVNGPVTYDLVSLLKDAYIEWDEEVILDRAARYWQDARLAGVPVGTDFGEFYRDFEWMGLQRHLKILGIFARLHHRDGKDAYLADLPLVLRYARRTCARYSAFTPLARLFDAMENEQAKAGIAS